MVIYNVLGYVIARVINNNNDSVRSKGQEILNTLISYKLSFFRFRLYSKSSSFTFKEKRNLVAFNEFVDINIPDLQNGLVSDFFYCTFFISLSQQ